MMRVLLLTLLFTCALARRDCSATFTLIERAGSWMDSGISHRIFDGHLTNTGTCAFSGAVDVAITMPPGGSMGYSWGYNRHQGKIISVPATAPQQTFSGIGFIYEGRGTPSATVGTIHGCECQDPSDPTPTDTPTSGPTPTGQPTQPATVAPTSPPPTAAPTLPPASGFDRSFAFLALTCGKTADGDNFNVMTQTLNSMGVIADIYDKTVWGTAAFSLTNTDGSGKYYAIVASTDISCWSADQQTQIHNYQKNFKVKLVCLSTAPAAANGLSLATSTGATMTMTYAPAIIPFARSMKTDAEISVYDSWINLATISDSTKAKAAFNLKDATGNSYVGAALIEVDNRKELDFFFASGTWANYASIVATVWMNWVTNGLFSGARRIILNCHADDMFMFTEMWDPSKHAPNDKIQYRINNTDIDMFLSWKSDLVARMPAGSNYSLTLPFNGATVVQDMKGYDKDPLYQHMAQPEVLNQFLWESHTWGHPSLDDLTHDECYSQWSLNNDTAKMLFGEALDSPVYSPTAVITPAISGLTNGPCLQAMYELGIRVVCSDNTHHEQDAPNDYWGYYTNVSVNHWDGIFVVPRYATYMDYNSKEPVEIVDQYNTGHPTAQLTFEGIMALETTTNARYLLNYRHDPYMFHQVNLHHFDYNGKQTNLISHWTDLVVAEVMKYSTLPLHSYRHIELADKLLARQARDQCGFQGTLRVDSNTNQIVGMRAVTTKACRYAISGAEASCQGATVEHVGEETTIWIDMTPNVPVDIVFKTPISMD